MEVLDWKWNSERHLNFSHVLLTETLGACKAREIWSSIDFRLDLWERGIHASLLGGALSEGWAREGRVARSEEEEEVRLTRIFHITLL